MNYRQRQVKQEILFSQMLLCGAETVSAKLLEWPSTDPLTSEQENQLLGRGEELISLALAQTTHHAETARTILADVKSSAAHRLSVLSNTRMRYENGEFPISIFAQAAALANWITTATALELSAIFTNPSLGSGFLVDILRRNEPFDMVADDTLLAIVFCLSENSRMQTPTNSDDGGEAYDYNKTFAVAAELAASCPVTTAWANALASLLVKMPAEFNQKRALEIAERWKDTDSHAGDVAAATGDLNAHQRIRFALARLNLGSMFVGTYSPDHRRTSELIRSDDPALRAAAYSFGKFSAEQMALALKSDGALARTFFIDNQRCWENPEFRDELESEIDELPYDDFLRRKFRRIETDFKHQNPQWFSEVEAEPETISNQLSTLIAPIVVDIQKRDSLESAISIELKRINKHNKAVTWIAIVAFIVALVK